MPADLRQRLRYPQTIFAIQSAMFATFHMTNPAVFYNREDQWEVPSFEVERPGPADGALLHDHEAAGREAAAPEYIQMIPFTPRQKDNLAAWMAARSDGEHYGKLVAFQFPKQTVIFGPRQIAARISQDQVIAPQIALWNQQGSTVIQGTLLVIPIEESLIYIRPLYLRAAGGLIPELKRVIVAYQNQIVMEATLDEALARLFSGRGAAAAPAARRPCRRDDGAGAAPGAAPADAAALAPRRAPHTSARCRRSARATGRSTAKRSSGWARCWRNWRDENRSRYFPAQALTSSAMSPSSESRPTPGP